MQIILLPGLQLPNALPLTIFFGNEMNSKLNPVTEGEFAVRCCWLAFMLMEQFIEVGFSVR
jgi:hypothetical protein